MQSLPLQETGVVLGEVKFTGPERAEGGVGEARGSQDAALTPLLRTPLSSDHERLIETSLPIRATLFKSKSEILFFFYKK